MTQTESECLCFESFLQKRKDTLKLRWVTYWFRLQNTTLFFYTQSHGSALHLRGHYYVCTFGKLLEQDMAALGRGLGDFLLKTLLMKATCERFGQWDDDFIYLCDVTGIHKEVTHFVAKAVAMVLTQVQSVREVQADDKKRFMFEIIMTSGKRKMLAADTAALRRDWVRCLWQAMHLSTSDAGIGRSRNRGASEQRRAMSNIYADVESVVKDSGASGPGVPDPTPEEPIYQNAHFRQPRGLNEEAALEGSYDVLPTRRGLQVAEPSSCSGNGVYDCPISCRTPADQESPYDVPSAVLRKLPDNNVDHEDELCWKI